MEDNSKQIVLALIPARSGSKILPDKNIKPMNGKPLMAWSIGHAQEAESVGRIIVSTDSETYAAIAREYGAEVPFLRPADISGDHASDLDVFKHALTWLLKNEGSVPEFCVHLRPTCPLRDPAVIDQAVALLRAHPELDSVRTVRPASFTPFKMWFRDEQGQLKPVVSESDVQEPWNQARQLLPQVYEQTANIDVVRSRVILKENSMTGLAIHGILEERLIDIDTAAEFERASLAMADGKAAATQEREDCKSAKVFCFDIDGVLATQSPNLDYSKAEPIQPMIEKANKLYDAGHTIMLFTARGTMTGLDWFDETERQMKAWGVRYHELKLGKPAADYYIDDRMISFEALNDYVESMG